LEKIKGIYIETTNWAELDLLTTTFKKKRHSLVKHYKE